MLCAVSCATYPRYLTLSWTIARCQEAQLQGSSSSFDVPSGHGCPKAANLTKTTSSCLDLLIGSWRPLDLIIFGLALIWVFGRYLTRIDLAAAAFAVEVRVPSSTSTIISSHWLIVDDWALSSSAFWRLYTRHAYHSLLLPAILWSHLACYAMSRTHYDAILFVWNGPSRAASLWLSTRARGQQLLLLMLHRMNIGNLFFVWLEYRSFLLILRSVDNWTIHHLVVAADDILWLWPNRGTLGLTRVRLKWISDRFALEHYLILWNLMNLIFLVLSWLNIQFLNSISQFHRALIFSILTIRSIEYFVMVWEYAVAFVHDLVWLQLFLYGRDIGHCGHVLWIHASRYSVAISRIVIARRLYVSVSIVVICFILIIIISTCLIGHVSIISLVSFVHSGVWPRIIAARLSWACSWLITAGVSRICSWISSLFSFIVWSLKPAFLIFLATHWYSLLDLWMQLRKWNNSIWILGYRRWWWMLRSRRSCWR